MTTLQTSQLVRSPGAPGIGRNVFQSLVRYLGDLGGLSLERREMVADRIVSRVFERTPDLTEREALRQAMTLLLGELRSLVADTDAFGPQSESDATAGEVRTSVVPVRRIAAVPEIRPVAAPAVPSAPLIAPLRWLLNLRLPYLVPVRSQQRG